MATFSDDFADNLNDWTQDTGSWSIVSGHAESSTASQIDTMRVTAAFDGDDHHAYCDMQAGSFLNVRKASSTHTCYTGHFNGPWGGGDSWSIGEITAGTYVSLDSAADSGWPTTSTVDVTIEGTALDGTLNAGNALTATDSTITSGTYMGLSSFFAVAGWFDDFYGEDISGVGAVDVIDSKHIHVSEKITLSQLHHLSIKESKHNHKSETDDYQQAHNLSVDSNTHNHTSDQVDLSIEGITDLNVFDSTHLHKSDIVLLDQLHDLQVKESTHNHTSDAITFAEETEVLIEDSAHNHTADIVDLREIITINPQSARHVHTSEIIDFYQYHNIDIGSARHNHVSDQNALEQTYELGIISSKHNHTSDLVDWTPAPPFTPDPNRVLAIDGISTILNVGQAARNLQA